jgi:hypothetical protein
MTDRINALTVVLKDDIREDDVEPLMNAIRLLQGVVSVNLHVADIGSHIAKERAKAYYRDKIVDILLND